MARRTLLLIAVSMGLLPGCAEQSVERYAITPQAITQGPPTARDTAPEAGAVAAAPTAPQQGDPATFDERSDVAGQDLLERMVGGRTRTTVGDVQGDSRAARDRGQVAMNNLRQAENGLDRLPDPVGGDLLADITDLPDGAPAEDWTESWPAPAPEPTPDVADDHGIPTMVGEDLLDDVIAEEPPVVEDPVEITITQTEPEAVETNLQPLVTIVHVTGGDPPVDGADDPAPAPTHGNMREVTDGDDGETAVTYDEEQQDMEPVGGDVLVDVGDDGMIEVTFGDEPQAMEPIGGDVLTDIGEGGMIEVTFGDEPQAMEPIGGDVLTDFGEGGMIDVTFGDEPQAMEPIGGDVLTDFGEGGMIDVTFGDEPQDMEPIGGDVLTDFGEGGMIDVTFGDEPQAMEPIGGDVLTDFGDDGMIVDMTGDTGMIDVDATETPATSQPAPEVVVAPWRDHRVAVVNNSTHPAPTGVAASLDDRMRLDGYPLTTARGCDLLVVCRRNDLKMAPPPGAVDPAFALTTTLQFHEQEPGLPVTPWVASIIVTVDAWTDRGQSVHVLRDIEIRVGSQGLDGPRFNQRHLDELRETLNAWALANSGRVYR